MRARSGLPPDGLVLLQVASSRQRLTVRTATGAAVCPALRRTPHRSPAGWIGGTPDVTIRQLFGLGLRRWRIVVPALLLGLGAGLGLTMVLRPTYSTQTLLFVSSTLGSPAERVQDAQFTSARVSSYAQMVDTPAVRQELRTQLGLGPADPVVTSISGTNPIDTAIIQVDISAATPRRVEAVAGSIGDALDRVVGRLESPAPGSPSPVRVSSVSQAALLKLSRSPSRTGYGLVGACAGLVAGLAIGAARDAAERRRLEAAVRPATAPGRPVQDGAPEWRFEQVADHEHAGR